MRAQRIGTNARKVVPSIACPFVLGQEETFVDGPIDFDLDRSSCAVLVLETSHHMNVVQGGDGVPRRSVAVPA